MSLSYHSSSFSWRTTHTGLGPGLIWQTLFHLRQCIWSIICLKCSSLSLSHSWFYQYYLRGHLLRTMLILMSRLFIASPGYSLFPLLSTMFISFIALRKVSNNFYLIVCPIHCPTISLLPILHQWPLIYGHLWIFAEWVKVILSHYVELTDRSTTVYLVKDL